MDYEAEKLQQAKMFMEHLVNGIDPVTFTDVNADTLRNEQIISCFRYISGILDKKIGSSERGFRSHDAFYITDEQLAALNTHPYKCKVSEIADEINRVTAVNRTKKMPATWINDWLEAEGYLCQSDIRSRLVTEKGKQLGITSEYRQRKDGTEYYVNFYPEQAQDFVFRHLKEIIALRNERNPESQPDERIPSTEYPSELSVKDFIAQHPDKCFIMSVGSCEPTSQTGSCTAVLLFKGKSKVLKKSNIPADSESKCILSGILDASAAIKLPTDVIILSSIPLGFNTPQSTNYDICRDIYRILTEKSCCVSFAVCSGKEYELNDLVNSLS